MDLILILVALAVVITLAGVLAHVLGRGHLGVRRSASHYVGESEVVNHNLN
jgi:hypothetical protein